MYEIKENLWDSESRFFRANLNVFGPKKITQNWPQKVPSVNPAVSTIPVPETSKWFCVKSYFVLNLTQ